MYCPAEARFSASDPDSGRADCLHEGEPVVEGDPARPGGVFELVRVKLRVDDAAEQVVEHDGQVLCRQPPVQPPNVYGIIKEIGFG